MVSRSITVELSMVRLRQGFTDVGCHKNSLRSIQTLPSGNDELSENFSVRA